MRACQLLRCSVAAALALVSAGAWAQLEITSSPNVVGSGARALGMGSAFIAIADDATAASWNPGGLTQLERPEVSLVLSQKWLSEDFTSRQYRGLSGDYSVDFADINYASFVYPIRRTIGGRNLVLSLNYQQQYDFERDIQATYRTATALGFGSSVALTNQVDYRQRGSLAALSPAFGFELTQRLSFGVVMNIWDDSILPNNSWNVRQTFRTRGVLDGTPFSGLRGRTDVSEDFDNFKGTNFTLGMLFKPTERLSIGAVYNTKLRADIDYSRDTIARVAGVPLFRNRESRRMEYVFPSAFGIGLAYRFPNDKLTLSFDVTRRDWKQFIIHDPENRNPLLRRRSGVTGLTASESTVKPTYTVRLGAEYVFVDETKPIQNYLPSLRGGIFYDPEPSGNRESRYFALGTNTLGSGDGKPDDYFGVALGTGVLIKNRVNLDAAYVYRWGRGVRSDTFGLGYTDANVQQHLLYLSTVIYF